MPEPGWSQDRERLHRCAPGFAKLCKKSGFLVTAAHVERTAGYLREERKRLVVEGVVGRGKR